jgi:hypothetical protein
MVDTPAFHADVIAYPAITVITNEAGGATRVAHRPEIDRTSLSRLTAELTGPLEELNGCVKEIEDVAAGAEPWILESFDQLALVRRLEADFSLMEEAGCKVGIGVATGADKAYIDQFDDLDVEADRKLPLVMTTDIKSGVVEWRGRGIINPFLPDGRFKGLSEIRSAPAQQCRPGSQAALRQEKPSLLVPDH